MKALLLINFHSHSHQVSLPYISLYAIEPWYRSTIFLGGFDTLFNQFAHTLDNFWQCLIHCLLASCFCANELYLAAVRGKIWFVTLGNCLQYLLFAFYARTNQLEESRIVSATTIFKN